MTLAQRIAVTAVAPGPNPAFTEPADRRAVVAEIRQAFGVDPTPERRSVPFWRPRQNARLATSRGDSPPPTRPLSN